MIEVARLNLRLLSGFRAAIAEVPDAYYAPRVARGNVFGLEDMVVTAQCLALKPARVTEIGCGFGQLSMLLASYGVNVVGIDANRRRAEVAGRLAAVVGSRARFLCGPFPDVWSPCDLMLFANVASAWWREQPGSTHDKIRRVLLAPALICPATWFEERTPPDYGGLFDELRDAGCEVQQCGVVWHVTPRWSP